MAAAKLTAIFGTSRRVGRWKVAKKSEALVLFGRCHVDFRDAYADPEVETLSLKIFCLFGSATVIFPEGASVEPSVVSVLSSSRFDVDASSPEAELPPLVLVSTTLFGRCHASTAHVHVEELAGGDPLEDWALNTTELPPNPSEHDDFPGGLTDPTPMPQLHQPPSMGAHVRLGEMESAWPDLGSNPSSSENRIEDVAAVASMADAPNESVQSVAHDANVPADEQVPEDKEPALLTTLDRSLAVDLEDVTTLRISA